MSSFHRTTTRTGLGAAGVAAALLLLPTVASAAPVLPSQCTQTGTTVTCTYLASGGQQTLAVPAGATAVSVVVKGGAGGRGGAGGTGRAGGAGGSGGVVTGSLTGVAGVTLRIVPGPLGANGTDSGNGGGDGGAGAGTGGGGGDGATVVGTSDNGGAGGAGGGSSAVLRDDTAQNLVVGAGGGGGGGGGGYEGDSAPTSGPAGGGGAGGAAGTDGAPGRGQGTAPGGKAASSGSPNGAEAPGAALPGAGEPSYGAGGPGGGGGGVEGGGAGGFANETGGGGGGGGSNLVPSGGSATTTNTGGGSVTITYSTTSSTPTPTPTSTSVRGDVQFGSGYRASIDVRGTATGGSGSCAVSAGTERAVCRSITSVTRSGNTATIKGTAVSRAGLVPFSTTVVDGARPGVRGSDTVTVTVGGRTVTGTVTRGDLSVG
ncbi:hypothetical protein GCM10023201_33530 [Actinomycetospora corticicola]|uniref:Glycine rich protein n=1 Tax=Actinomycetospora corticicola TaxID=663602 RepID=A0A7Y9J4B6_9PSEU|nr:hypothetical protein [Actinomycetospora corticicola]NYD34524.1 hypothetical protein [Actinomycetospora corticicola]